MQSNPILWIYLLCQCLCCGAVDLLWLPLLVEMEICLCMNYSNRKIIYFYIQLLIFYNSFLIIFPKKTAGALRIFEFSLYGQMVTSLDFFVSTG